MRMIYAYFAKFKYPGRLLLTFGKTKLELPHKLIINILLIKKSTYGKSYFLP